MPAVTSAAFTITPAAPATLSFTTQPSTTTAGSVITPAVQVTVLDTYGNPVNTTAVTLALGSNPGNDTLVGTSTVHTVNGVATFSNLKLEDRRAGLYADGDGHRPLPAVTSAPFTITPAAPATLTFTTQPSTTMAGSAITPAVQVTVLDAYGNPVNPTAVTLALGANPGNDTLHGTTHRADRQRRRHLQRP